MPKNSPFSKSDYCSHFNRRAKWHDYRQPCFYLITLLKQKWVPQLAEIPAMTLPRPKDMLRSEVGKIIDKNIHAFNAQHNQISIQTYVIMPDHIHMIVRVREELPEVLGCYIKKFKASCSREYALISQQLGPKATHITNTSHPESEITTSISKQPLCEDGTQKILPIYTEGFNDRILLREGQLNRWNRYINDNPRRLQIRRSNPELFTKNQRLKIEGVEYMTIGNIFLLRTPECCAVRHSSRFSEAEIAKLKKSYRYTAHNRGVFISPFIHKNEKAVRQEAIRQGASIIEIKHNGFPERWKPGGEDFDLCAAGRLLIIAPIHYEPLKEKSALTRAQCMEMNALAEQLANLTDRSNLILRR